MPSPIIPTISLASPVRGLKLKPAPSAFLARPYASADNVTFAGNNPPRRLTGASGGGILHPLVSALPTQSIPRIALPENLTLPSDSLLSVFMRYRPHCTTTDQAMALANRLNTKRFCVSAPDHDSVYDLDMLDTHPVVMEQKGRIILDMLDNAEAMLTQAEGKTAKTNAGIDRIDRLEAFLLERLATTGHMPYLKSYDARLQTATVVSLQPQMHALDHGLRVYTFNARNEVVLLKSGSAKAFRQFDEPVMKPRRATDGPDSPQEPLTIKVRDPDSYAIKPNETVHGLETVAYHMSQRLTHPVVRKSVRKAFDRLGDNRTDVAAFTRDVTEVMAIINDSLNIRPDIEVEPLPPKPTGKKRERLGISLAPAYFNERTNTVGFIPAALWEIFDQLDDQYKGNPTLAKYKRAEYVLKAMVEEAQHGWQHRLVKALLMQDFDSLTHLGRYGDSMFNRLGDYVANLACYNQATQFQMIGLDIDHWYKKQPIERDAKTVVDLVIDNVADAILPPKA